MSWETYELPATNPMTGAAVIATRRRPAPDLELPLGDAYAAYVMERLRA